MGSLIINMLIALMIGVSIEKNEQSFSGNWD